MDNTKYICNLSGKYSKRALMKLEELGVLTTDIRKVILDAFNDYRREIEKIENVSNEIRTDY